MGEGVSADFAFYLYMCKKGEPHHLEKTVLPDHQNYTYFYVFGANNLILVLYLWFESWSESESESESEKSLLG